MSLNESIIKIRCELQKKNLKKSGHNKFAGFDYFELADFLPTLNELMMAEGVNDIFGIEDGEAVLVLVKDKECNTYKIPFTQFATPLNKSGQPSMQDIQYLGALNTYYKRYLYLNAFGITDGDIIDAMDQQTVPKKAPKEDPIITAEQGKQLENLIKSVPGDSPYEERLAGCLNRVGCNALGEMKVSQWEFLMKLLQNNIKKMGEQK